MRQPADRHNRWRPVGREVWRASLQRRLTHDRAVTGRPTRRACRSSRPRSPHSQRQPQLSRRDSWWCCLRWERQAKQKARPWPAAPRDGAGRMMSHVALVVDPGSAAPTRSSRRTSRPADPRTAEPAAHLASLKTSATSPMLIGASSGCHLGQSSSAGLLPLASGHVEQRQRQRTPRLRRWRWERWSRLVGR